MISIRMIEMGNPNQLLAQIWEAATNRAVLAVAISSLFLLNAGTFGRICISVYYMEDRSRCMGMSI